MITNPRRKKQIEDFIDKDHKVIDRYYELLDADLPLVKLRKAMEKLIEIDPDFYDPYIVAADIFGERLNGVQKAKDLLKRGYERAVKRIVDNKGNYPKELIWGYLENRHLIRILDRYALECWLEGNTEEALDIYRKLLRSNPNDNIGARHSILEILLGLTPHYQDEFAVDDESPYLDASKVSAWFDHNVKKFPGEFNRWFKEMTAREKMTDLEERDEEGSFHLFYGCVICEAIKQAEKEGRSLSAEELHQLFERANRDKDSNESSNWHRRPAKCRQIYPI